MLGLGIDRQVMARDVASSASSSCQRTAPKRVFRRSHSNADRRDAPIVERPGRDRQRLHRGQHDVGARLFDHDRRRLILRGDHFQRLAIGAGLPERAVETQRQQPVGGHGHFAQPAARRFVALHRPGVDGFLATVSTGRDLRVR